MPPNGSPQTLLLVLEFACSETDSQLEQCPGSDLAGALGVNVETLTDLFVRVLSAILKTEAHHDDAFFTIRQITHLAGSQSVKQALNYCNWVRHDWLWLFHPWSYTERSNDYQQHLLKHDSNF